jgi:UPF0176 protein
MTLRVAALYRFVPLSDHRELVPRLEGLCAELDLKGTLLLAPEGINGTIAGRPEAVDALLDAVQRGPLFGRRLDGLELKLSTAAAQPFGHLKVRAKREIVTFDGGVTDPRQAVGRYVEPKAWNGLLADPDLVLVDTRNAFEVAFGSVAGAIDPGLRRFSDFKPFVRQALAPQRQRPMALFCTGGIRCEKASAYLLAQGFDKVYHLKGGILNYLNVVPEAESLWTGTCFVFDGRTCLGHGLREKGSGHE